MTFSRPFRALLKLSVLWALPWTALGVGVGVIQWITSPELASITSLGGWLLGHALAYGALGWISGLYLGLVIARVGRGRIDALSRPKVALLAALGGAAPPAIFGALGLMFGAPPAAFWSLLGLGVVSTVGSVALVWSTQAAVAPAALVGSTGLDRLPAAR
jgi:hypothetical protein